MSTRSDSPARELDLVRAFPTRAGTRDRHALDALEDEAFAAEKAGADAARERDRDVDAARRAEKCNPSAR